MVPTDVLSKDVFIHLQANRKDLGARTIALHCSDLVDASGTSCICDADVIDLIYGLIIDNLEVSDAVINDDPAIMPLTISPPYTPYVT